MKWRISESVSKLWNAIYKGKMAVKRDNAIPTNEDHDANDKKPYKQECVLGAKVIDDDYRYGSMVNQNRSYIEEVYPEDDEPYLLIRNTNECLSSEDGVRERRYHTFTLSPMALLAMVDVTLRYASSPEFREFSGRCAASMNYLHNKYKEELEDKGITVKHTEE